MTIDEMLKAAREGRDDELPIAVDIPVAGMMADMERGPSYQAAKTGYMPTIQVGPGRKKVPTRRWLAILRGEAA